MKGVTPTLKELKIEIESNEGKTSPGTLSVHLWEGKEKTGRAIRITAKILSRVLLLCLVAVFVHPLIIPSVLTATLSFIGAPLMFSYFMDQSATFTHGSGQCPNCTFNGRLNPFMKNTLKERVTLLCSQCGQSCQALVKD